MDWALVVKAGFSYIYIYKWQLVSLLKWEVKTNNINVDIDEPFNPLGMKYVLVHACH